MGIPVTISAELLQSYCFWGTILALKLLLMAPLTARHRLAKKMFANPEDAKMDSKNAKVVLNDPDIERVRRAHLNDLENIPIWYVITYLWLTTGPSAWLATILIRTFVLARIGHTLAYVVLQKQPHRAIAYFIGIAITVYEAICTLMYYM